jgi:hypothetical protein
MLPHKRTVIIHVHPPEAEAIARAYSAAGAASGAVLDRLSRILGTLDLEWEGRQKTLFVEEFRTTIERIRGYLLPLLKNREQKYHTFTAEKKIEEVQYY